MTYEASKIWVPVLRERNIHLLPTRERKRRLLFRTDLKDRAKVIRTKAKMGAFRQAGQVICYFCRQPGHFRWDCPRRQKSKGYGTPQSQSSMRQVRVARQDRKMVCYHYQQPGHMRRDCPQRQGSQGFGTAQSQSAVGQERPKFVPPPPSMGQGNQYQFQGVVPSPSTS